MRGSRRIERFPLLVTWMVLAVVLAVSGCMPAARGARASASPMATEVADGFVRHVAAFEVLDEHGIPYDHPFLGGFDVPRPQFVDIDADLDLDLFVQERSGELMFFENVGSAAQSEFVWRTDRYEDLEIGDWNRFADLDGDGDLDLLGEHPFSYVRYFENIGSPSEASFLSVPDSVRDAEGVAVFSDRQNIPSLTDIDCDGAWDLFLGRVDGTVARYELDGMDPTGTPRFRFIRERFQDIQIVAQIGSRHGANSMAFADVDSDGDNDLFWGDFFEPSLLFIENRGSCANPVIRDEPFPFAVDDTLRTSGYNAPVLNDIDGDQDLDLFIGVLGGAFNPNLTASDNFYFYEQTTSGFTRRSERFLEGIDVGSESVPAFTDFDEDGDLDMLVGNKIDPGALDTGRLYLFENVGTSRAPRFALADTLDLRTAFHQAPAFADLDADGDDDLLLGTWNAGVALLRKDDVGAFSMVDTAMVTLTRGSHSTPALADIDADGDFDLFVGEASGDLNFYRNEGSPQTPDFVLESDKYGGIDAGRRSYPVLFDADGDGDFDMLLGREAGGTMFLRNVGTTREPEFVEEESYLPEVVKYGTPVMVDIDADGDADLFAGGLSGGVMFWENTGR